MSKTGSQLIWRNGNTFSKLSIRVSETCTSWYFLIDFSQMTSNFHERFLINTLNPITQIKEIAGVGVSILMLLYCLSYYIDCLKICTNY